MRRHLAIFSFFFFNDTATTEIYTLSLHDALPISKSRLMKSQPRRQALSTKRLVTTGMVRPERRTRWVAIESSRGTGLRESPEADGTRLRPSPGRAPHMRPPERADAAPG